MNFKQSSLLALPALGLTACLTPVVSAATIGDYQFNTASDTEGWAVLLNASGLTADGDSLNGTATNNDPQLTNGAAGLTTTGTWDTFVFRVREIQNEAPAGPVDAFNSVGQIVQLNGTVFNLGLIGVDSGDDFYTVTLDISSFGSAAINSIRLDPIGGASSNSNSETSGNTFEIDYIQINDDTPIPEPSSLALLGMGALAMMRRRR